MTQERNERKSIFNGFTRQYSLSKTLRFELRPIWNTQKMLDEERVFEIDGLRREKYEKTKPWVDRLHQEFIEDALFDFKFKDLNSFRRAFESWQRDKKSKDEQKRLAEAEKKLREEIVGKFNITAKKWAEKYPELKLKKNDIGVLFEAGIFKVLKERYGNEDEVKIIVDDKKEVNIFDNWSGWTGYFKKFFQTRKNFYSSGDESTAVAYRIVNQGLRRFIQNIQLFEQIKSKIDITEIEKRLNILYDKIFSLENYNTCLLQDGIDLYNRAIGGEVRGKDEKIPGLNQAINEYRQKNRDDKIKFLKMLDKQIHGKKEKFINAIESDEELTKQFKLFVKASDNKLNAFRKLIADFVTNSNSYDLNKIYISSDTFGRNANRWFSDYAVFERALLDTGREKNIKEAYGLLDQKLPREKDGQVKYPDFLILAHIKLALNGADTSVFKEKYNEEITGFGELEPFEQFLSIVQFEVEQQFSHEDTDGQLVGYEVYRSDIAFLLNSSNQKIDRNAKILVKNFADSALTVYQIAKYFAVEKKRRWLDSFDLDDRFYNAVDIGYLNFYGDTAEFKSAYEEIVQGYNILRNYITKKPYSTDKWLLNFDIQALAEGWDKNLEDVRGTVIFRKNGRYYLGIMHREHRDLFSEKFKQEFLNGDFEKIEYKQIANPAFDIYNLILNNDGKIVKRSTKKETKETEWPKDILRIYNEKTYTKEYFNRNDFEKYINYIKQCALRYWPQFDLKFSSTSSYKNISDFTNEINKYAYKTSFISINEQYIKNRNNHGQLFIFEIHNKDWNLKDGKKKDGTKNLHTLYWEQLFSEENKDSNFIFALNGGAELFFRPKTKKEKLGEKLDGKKRKVVSHKRYAEDKIFFHCPITLNRVSENKTDGQLNADIRKAIVDNKELRIIGVDRGEKHLAYYSVIDQGGKIIEDGSLNTIGKADGKPVPYAEILEKRSKEREVARREWQEVEQIKDIKRGYVSQIVRTITDLAIEYNAIVVLEDLSMRFKQVRGGIEKSIYQQFEKQLIGKLSFLVNKKETDITRPGHPLKARQLASPVTASKDMGKQTGIIFYTAASYTSRTCPECGYRRNVRFRFENVDKAKVIIKNLEKFVYDSKNDSFIVTYSLKKLLSKEQQKESKTKNKLYEGSPRKDIFVLNTKDTVRYKWFQHTSPRLRTLASEEDVTEYKEINEQQTKRGVVKIFNISEYLKKLFSDADISMKDGDLREKIVNNDRSKEFYEKLLFVLFLLTETRQTVSGTSVDFIQCPECGFDSRKKFQGREFNGDANGAYNIARKGVMVLEKMRQFEKKEDLAKMGWGDLSINIEEWDNFTQNKHN